jgi:hypothetical protein
MFIAQAKKEIEDDKPIGEIKILINELLRFTYTVESDLYLLTQLTGEFYSKNQDLISRNICLLDSKKIVQKYNLDKLIFGLWQETLSKLPEPERSSARSFAFEYSPRRSMIDKWKVEGIQKFDKKQLNTAAKRILIHACEVIDIFLFDEREIEDDQNVRTREMAKYLDHSQAESDFYNRFIEETATLAEWKKFPNTGFRMHYDFYYTPSQEGWDKINKHQKKLFYEALKIEMDILKSEISNLPEPFKKNNLTTQLAIISKFISGDYKPLDIKRLNRIIEFTDPEEVIIELDDMNRYDVYNYGKFLPYDGELSKKSPRFVAELLIEYKNLLERVLASYVSRNSVMDDIDDDLSDLFDEEKPKLPKPNAFKLMLKPQKEEILKKVTFELMKFDFINTEEHNISELNNILLCSNFKEIEKPIQFGAQTNFCCQILKEFFPFFENMNAASIAQSRLFKTQSGRLLTQTNFNKSVKSGSKREEELTEIKKIIRQLEEKNSKSSKN